jgi:hypothetical protein
LACWPTSSSRDSRRFTGASPQAIIAAHVTQAPVPVSQIRTAVPPALAALVMRCLAKKPADRFQSAEGTAARAGGARDAERGHDAVRDGAVRGRRAA